MKERSMGSLRTIDEEWRLYRQMVIPKDAHEVQVENQRQTFYAGAWVAQTMLLNIVTDEIAETKIEELYRATEKEVQNV